MLRNMRAAPKYAPRTCALIAALVLGSGCQDAPTAPLRSPSPPVMDLYGPGSPVSIPVPDTSGEAVTRYATGLHLPDSSMVVIHVDGALSLAVQQGYAPLNTRTASMTDTTYAGSKAPPTGLVYRGWTYSAFSVTVTYATSGYTPSLVADPNVSDGARTDTLWVVHGEDLLVTRSTVSSRMTCTRAYPGELPCGTPAGPDSMYNVPSYHLTGSQSIYIERLDGRISLSAAPSTGSKGRTVTFTPRIPAWDGGVNAAAWSWTPDGGTKQGVACYTASPCAKVVNESGTMTLTVTFNAHAAVPALKQQASVHVNAVDCPSGDSVLDDDHFRSVLKLVYDSSGAETKAYAQRRELAGGYYMDPGNDTTTYLPYLAPSTPCTFQLPVPYPTSPPIPWLRAIPHAHPTDTVEVVPPNTCPLAPAGGETQPGPSPGDDSVAAQAGVPVFAVDRQNVYRTDGTIESHKMWPRKQNGCTLF